MRILVLDGNENQAVASVRSLARAGHTVTVGASTRWSKAGWSRASAGSFQYPAPQHDATAFVRRVVEEARREPGTLVLPMTERTTLILSAARAQLLEARARFVLPSHENLLRAFDKSCTTDLAASLGIPVPKTVILGTSEDPGAVTCELQYPLVLKPRASEELSHTGAAVATGSPRYARSREDFRRAFDELRRRCSEILVQEFIAGRGAGYFALMKRGELRADFAHERIRDVRPTGSGSAVRMSVRPDPRVREWALGMLRALEWHGVAMVEFRMRSDGTPFFLEVNGRFWNSLPLAVHAGVDFPALVAELATDGERELQTDYREGVRCRWLLGDFRHLVEVLRGPPPGFPGQFPSRFGTMARFLIPVPGTFHDNFEWRDPMPAVGDWLDFFGRKIPAALSKPSRSPR